MMSKFFFVYTFFPLFSPLLLLFNNFCKSFIAFCCTIKFLNKKMKVIQYFEDHEFIINFLLVHLCMILMKNSVFKILWTLNRMNKRKTFKTEKWYLKLPFSGEYLSDGFFGTVLTTILFIFEIFFLLHDEKTKTTYGKMILKLSKKVFEENFFGTVLIASILLFSFYHHQQPFFCFFAFVLNRDEDFGEGESSTNF